MHTIRKLMNKSEMKHSRALLNYANDQSKDDRGTL